MRTVDWTAPRIPGTRATEAEGLRERKKRLMRQQLSDTGRRRCSWSGASMRSA